MKKKLIELLYRAHHNASAVMAGGEGDYHDALNEEADYLIAYGVIVLPVQPEQVVYETTEFLDGTPAPEIYHYSDWWVNVGLDKENGGYRFNYDSVDICHSDIGKTIFFSEADAEKSLRMDGADNDL